MLLPQATRKAYLVLSMATVAAVPDNISRILIASQSMLENYNVMYPTRTGLRILAKGRSPNRLLKHLHYQTYRPSTSFYASAGGETMQERHILSNMHRILSIFQ